MEQDKEEAGGNKTKKLMKARHQIFVINTPQGVHLLEINTKDRTLLKPIKF
jgi:hypothetical protein